MLLKMPTRRARRIMSEPIKRLTDSGRNALLQLANTNPELWQDPETDFDIHLRNLGVPDYAEEIGVLSHGAIELPSGNGYYRSERPKMDRNGPTLCDILRGLRPEQASDGRVWEWLTHCRLHRYACERWPRINNANVNEHILLHWFVRNENRDLYQNNTASRTFWVGTISERISGVSGGTLTRHQVAEHFSENPITYHNTMQSSMTNNPRIAALVVEALMTPGRGKGISSSGSITLWKQLNLSAGKILPEVLSDQEWSIIIDQHLDALMTQKEYVRDPQFLRGFEPYRVLSLGAGVQSTVLALMAERGEFGLPKPDIAIFADTQWEPKAVYDHLKWLETQVSFEIRTVTAGNIKENLRQGTMPDNSKFIGVPIYLAKEDGGHGLMRRQCTTQYKLKPIHKELRQIMGLRPRQLIPKHSRIEMWVGISVDEVSRVKPSQEHWIDKRFPLVDLGLSRAQLYKWFQDNYPGRHLPKSACIGCPYHSDAIWKDMKKNDPDAFMEAVEVDIDLRANPNITALTPAAQGFLHVSRRPLALVDFSATQGYQEQMNEECEGLCGI